MAHKRSDSTSSSEDPFHLEKYVSACNRASAYENAQSREHTESPASSSTKPIPIAGAKEKHTMRRKISAKLSSFKDLFGKESKDAKNKEMSEEYMAIMNNALMIPKPLSINKMPQDADPGNATGEYNGEGSGSNRMQDDRYAPLEPFSSFYGSDDKPLPLIPPLRSSNPDDLAAEIDNALSEFRQFELSPNVTVQTSRLPPHQNGFIQARKAPSLQDISRRQVEAVAAGRRPRYPRYDHVLEEYIEPGSDDSEDDTLPFLDVYTSQAALQAEGHLNSSELAEREFEGAAEDTPKEIMEDAMEDVMEDTAKSTAIDLGKNTPSPVKSRQRSPTRIPVPNSKRPATPVRRYRSSMHMCDQEPLKLNTQTLLDPPSPPAHQPQLPPKEIKEKPASPTKIPIKALQNPLLRSALPRSQGSRGDLKELRKKRAESAKKQKEVDEIVRKASAMSQAASKLQEAESADENAQTSADTDGALPSQPQQSGGDSDNTESNVSGLTYEQAVAQLAELNRAYAVLERAHDFSTDAIALIDRMDQVLADMGVPGPDEVIESDPEDAPQGASKSGPKH
ncbi:uncharacterized protein F4822DRAFT_199301 [Hypoxylon trugodes]|uniref:uncharacterized protein n=1 Tax=Hypoxylon trugodes TaxID=326681 RepID=UPI002192354C|nr:uncharacterized protein F4822DRAFT_199301 [Hypoxylon trugodes]KAI1389403.1 hypothetical protein F4822DRAFT_199301 [Hypoxylon trugodes]